MLEPAHSLPQLAVVYWFCSPGYWLCSPIAKMCSDSCTIRSALCTMQCQCCLAQALVKCTSCTHVWARCYSAKKLRFLIEEAIACYYNSSSGLRPLAQTNSLKLCIPQKEKCLKSTVACEKSETAAQMPKYKVHLKIKEVLLTSTDWSLLNHQ